MLEIQNEKQFFGMLESKLIKGELKLDEFIKVLLRVKESKEIKISIKFKDGTNVKIKV
jgi:hypothetical protein